jgi:hypothetical protein
MNDARTNPAAKEADRPMTDITKQLAEALQAARVLIDSTARNEKWPLSIELKGRVDSVLAAYEASKAEPTPEPTPELRVLVATEIAVFDGVDVYYCEDVPMKYYTLADAAIDRVERYKATPVQGQGLPMPPNERLQGGGPIGSEPVQGQDIEGLVSVLRFYADPKSWDSEWSGAWSDARHDHGDRARVALLRAIEAPPNTGTENGDE